MKILITGLNRNQTVRKYYLQQHLKVVPSHYSLFNCLIDMGYEVEHREVILGEDLSQYEHVIVFLASPGQLNALKVLGGLWAIYQRPDCILAYDDWQISTIFGDIRRFNTPEKILRPFFLDRQKATREQVLPYVERFQEAIKTIVSCKNRLLISSFSTDHLPEEYGPHKIFEGSKATIAKDRIFRYNPNPYHRNRTPLDFSHEGFEDPTYIPKKSLFGETALPQKDKERKFNFASLIQSRTIKWLKQQGVKFDADKMSIGDWDIDLYGDKENTRLTEDQMYVVYVKDWGCLMPGYEHSGSGWWRARPLQVADAGSILIGEKKELEVYYGKDFKYIDLKASDLIYLTDQELKNIAEEQKHALYTIHPLDKDVQKKEIQKVLEAK